jgi:hypothetical protein
MLAVAGYWFYQESRVDGALNVVAGTTPAAPAGAVLERRPAALPVTAPASLSAPAAPAVPDRSAVVAPPASSPAAPATQQDATAAANPEPAAVAEPPPVTRTPPVNRTPGATDDGAHGARTHKRARSVAARADTALDNIDGPLHRSAPAPHRKHVQADTQVRTADTRARSADAPGADGEPTPTERREETLMQCRVLGYDERECTRRGCAMTRFGLVCPG